MNDPKLKHTTKQLDKTNWPKFHLVTDNESEFLVTAAELVKLGHRLTLSPPHAPQEKAAVERFHQMMKKKCLEQISKRSAMSSETRMQQPFKPIHGKHFAMDRAQALNKKNGGVA